MLTHVSPLCCFLFFFCFPRKSLIASRSPDVPLQLTLSRGSSVYEDHQDAIIERCGQQNAMDSAADQCVVDYLGKGYHEDVDDDGDDGYDTTTANFNTVDGVDGSITLLCSCEFAKVRAPCRESSQAKGESLFACLLHEFFYR